ISLYNDARIDDKVVEEAVVLATWLYRKAGVETTWLNCSSSRVSGITDPGCHEAFGPTHLTLRIMRRATTFASNSFGAAFLSSDGTGIYSDVFYDGIQRLGRQDSRVNPSCILGHVL